MITQATLKELLHYDPDTGVFTWRVRPSRRVYIGDEAGSVYQRGNACYRDIKIDGVKYLAHRLAWLYTYSEFPAGQIDHIDGNGLHNWIINIRDVDNRENQKNSRLRSDNTSGTVGVSFDKASGKWKAQISTGSGRKRLGHFTDIKDAIAARKSAEVEYGYHENHGRSS